MRKQQTVCTEQSANNHRTEIEDTKTIFALDFKGRAGQSGAPYGRFHCRGQFGDDAAKVKSAYHTLHTYSLT